MKDLLPIGEKEDIPKNESVIWIFIVLGVFILTLVLGSIDNNIMIPIAKKIMGFM